MYKRHFENRRKVVLDQLADHFDLNGELVDITLNVRTEGSEDEPGGTVTLNTLTPCLLYTSDAADEEDSVGLGGRRVIKKKKTNKVKVSKPHR